MWVDVEVEAGPSRRWGPYAEAAPPSIRAQRIAAINHPSAQTHLAVVEYGRLPWRDGPLGLCKTQPALPDIGTDHAAGGVLLAVAGFGGQGPGCRGPA